MADFYDALNEIKEEVNIINFTIAREQDSLLILETTVKEWETKNTTQALEMTKLEMTAQALECEYNMGVLKNESLSRELDELNNEIESVDKVLEQKTVQMEQLQEFYMTKVNASNEIRERNNAKYSTIPCLKKYMGLSELCSQLSEAVSKLTVELNDLKERDAEESLLQTELDNDSSVETIDLEPDVPVESVSYQSMKDFGAMLQQLAEENRLLRKRLEELEMNSRRETILPEKLLPSKELEKKNRLESANVQQLVASKALEVKNGRRSFTLEKVIPSKEMEMMNRQEPFTLEKMIPSKEMDMINRQEPFSLDKRIASKELGLKKAPELFTFEKTVPSKDLAMKNSQEAFILEGVISSNQVTSGTHLDTIDVGGSGSFINFNFLSTCSPIGGSLF